MLKSFSADLHIHTLLSPCGDLEMSPANIVQTAQAKGIDILGITDHNSTKHCRLIRKLAKEEGIFVLSGTEVTSKEEVHCLAFFESNEILDEFQNYLEDHLPYICNKPETFGYQVVVDIDENIVEEIDTLLISALDVSVEDLEQKVHELNGIFIPAHINKTKNSIISQLGFISPDLKYEALELSPNITKKEFIKQNPYLKDQNYIQSSDAHYINDVGLVNTEFLIERRSFEEIKLALKGEKGRKVIVQ